MMYKKIGYFETFNYFLIRYHSSSPSIQNSQFCIDVSSSIAIFQVFSNIIKYTFFLCTFYSPVFQRVVRKGLPSHPETYWRLVEQTVSVFLFVSRLHPLAKTQTLSPSLHSSQWKIQFSQSLLIFSSLCGCLVRCMIRCCCCWPTRKSVESQDPKGVAATEAEQEAGYVGGVSFVCRQCR